MARFVCLNRKGGRPIYLNADLILAVMPTQNGSGSLVHSTGERVYSITEGVEEVVALLDPPPPKTQVAFA